MGCTSSIPVQPPADLSTSKSNDIPKVAVDNKVDLKTTFEQSVIESIMSTAEVQESKQIENETFSTCKEQRNSHLSSEITGNLPNIELEPVADVSEKEEEEEDDQFDVSSAPTTHKKEHATQSTLEFVYHHSSSTAPSQGVGNFPISPSGTVPTNSRSLSQRRPSGVPPPPRELKPGDYLYQRNLNNNFEMSEALEEDDEMKDT